MQENHNWTADFPIDEAVEDYSGKTRMFTITCFDAGLGFTVRAREKRRAPGGYGFWSYSETSPYAALGRVREKMRRNLASRYITRSGGRYQMLHDRLRGRIASDGRGGVQIVVDGIPLSIDDLQSMLATHEGFELEISIISAIE